MGPNRAWSRLAIGSLAAAAACTLPDFAPEGRPCPCAFGYVCNTASNQCEIAASTANAGGAGATQTTVVSSSSPSTVAEASATNATAGGGAEPAATPLVVTEAGNIFSYQVDGKFRLEGDASSRYQLARWIDLESDPGGVQSGTSRILYEALWVERSPSDWIGLANAGEVGVNAIEIRDEGPVRGTAVANLNFANLLSVTTTQTAYASGRVTLSFTAAAPALTPVDIANAEIHHLSLAETPPDAWDFERPNDPTFWFRRKLGAKPSVALFVSRSDETGLGHDFPSNTYFDLLGVSLQLGETITRTGELQIGIAGANDGDLAARAADLASPQILIRSDTTAVGNGYDPILGAYVATATGPVVEVGATPGLQRFAPAFEVRDWGGPAWVIRRGDVVEASNDAPIGAHVLARFDPESGTLLFVCLDTIAADAPEDERIFRIEAQ